MSRSTHRRRALIVSSCSARRGGNIDTSHHEPALVSSKDLSRLKKRLSPADLDGVTRGRKRKKRIRRQLDSLGDFDLEVMVERLPDHLPTMMRVHRHGLELRYGASTNAVHWKVVRDVYFFAGGFFIDIGRNQRLGFGLEDSNLLDLIKKTIKMVRPSSPRLIETVKSPKRQRRSAQRLAPKDKTTEPAPQSPQMKKPPGRSKRVLVFSRQDREYLRWMQANPNGYVLNFVVGDTADRVLHNARCPSINAEGRRRSTFPAGKACSNDRSTLIMWGTRRFRQRPRACGICGGMRPNTSW